MNSLRLLLILLVSTAFCFGQTPGITSITPANAAPGTAVTISGSNLSGVSAVSFGGVASTKFSHDSTAGTISATIPTTAKSGAVVVTTPAGPSSEFSYTIPLTIVTPPTHNVVFAGQALSFSVSVGGGAAGSSYSYTWRRLSGGVTTTVGTNSSSLYVPSVGSADVADYSVSVTDGTSTVTSVSAALRLAKPNVWTWRNPTTTGNDLWAVAHGNGRFVAVGRAGTILTSTDGSSWTPQAQQTPALFTNVAYLDSKFVVVGTSGNVLTSADGLTWTGGNVGESVTLYGVARSASIWVLTGSGGAIFTSANGTSWTRVPASAFTGGSFTSTLEGVIATASGFMTVSLGGHVLTGNADGSSWMVTQPAAGTALFDIRQRTEGGVTTTLISGASKILRSTDGTTWTAVTLPTTGLPSSVDWQRIVPTSVGWLVVGGNFTTTFNGYAVQSSDGLTWSLPSSLSGGPQFIGATHDGSQYVAVGTVGRIARSTDGSTWQNIYTGGLTFPGDLFASATGTAGTLVAGKVGQVYLSTNHETGWARVDLKQDTTAVPTSTNIYGAAQGAGTFVLVGGNDNTTAGAGKGFIFSSNLSGGASGSTWSKVEIAGPHFLAAAAYDPVSGRYVTAGAGNKIYYAKNPALIGETDGWTAVDKPGGSTAAVRAATAAGGRFVLSGDGGTIFTSADGVTWATVNAGTNVSLEAVAGSGGGAFVAGGHDGASSVLVRSTDNGATWARVSVPFTGTIRGMTYGDLRFRTVGGASSMLISADNGATWTAESTQFSGLFRAIVRTPKGYVAGGSNGAIATLSQPTATTAVADKTLVAGTAATSFTPVTGSGGVPSLTYGLSPTLPAGLQLNTSTGEISGTPQVSALTPGFAGTESFNSGSLAQWPYSYRLSGTNGELAASLATGRLEFSKGSGSGSRFLGWDGDRTSTSSRTTASYHTSWRAEVTAGNSLAPTAAGEFAATGLQVTSGTGAWATLVVSSYNGAVVVRGASVGLTTPVTATLSSGVGVRLRMEWDAATQTLTGSYNTDGGSTFIPLTTFPVASWTPGLAPNGFFFELLGDSSMAAPIPAGALWLDDFRVEARTPAVAVHTVSVTDAVGVRATSTFKLALSAASGATDALIVTAPPAPSLSVAAGGRMVLSVGATTAFGGVPTYQWKKGETVIIGATSPDFLISNVGPSDAGSYSVVVTSGSSSQTLTTNLTVLPADPVLWQQFASVSTEQAPARTVHATGGKVYVPWSVFDRNPDMVGGRLVGTLARLNESDGTLDTSFSLDRRYRTANHVVPLADGGALIAVSVGDVQTVIRVSSTGQRDTTFNSPFFARGIRFITLQTDGKVLVAATDNLEETAPAGSLATGAPSILRLNADGSHDASFSAALNDGAVLFGPPVLDSSGQIYLAGFFSSVNGTARVNLARLSSGGVVDGFAAPASLPAGFASSQARAILLQSDGRAVALGDFRSTARGTSSNPMMAVRFNTDGTYDATYVRPLRGDFGILTSRLRHGVILSDDRIVAVSDRLVRLNADGSRDTSFVSRAFGKEGFWVSRAADGRLFVADQISVAAVDGTPVSLANNGIACFAADGTPDFSFQTGGWGRSAIVTSGVPLSDGRVWVGGTFNRFGSAAAPGVAQFSATGALSSSQVVSGRQMTSAMVVPASGDRIFLLAATAGNSLETFSSGLARIGADGVIDGAFLPVLPAGYSLGSASVAAAPGGKALLFQSLIGAQAVLNGETGDSLLRLNTDGTRDTGFNSTLSSFASVERDPTTNAVTMIRTGGFTVTDVLSDGRVLAAGAAVDGSVRLVRLNVNGSLDTTFSAASLGSIAASVAFTSSSTRDPVTNTTAQFPISSYYPGNLIASARQGPDGKVYVGGRLKVTGAPAGLVRLTASGAIDTTFTGTGLALSSGVGAPAVVAMTFDDAGRLYVAGRFDSYNGNAVPGIFRLRADGSFDGAWQPGLQIIDAPRSTAVLRVEGGKLYVFGTVTKSGDLLPRSWAMVDVSAPSVPVISAITPANAEPGTAVTISGANFSGVLAITFGGVASTKFSYDPTAGTISATIPSTAKSGAVVVTNPEGSSVGVSFLIPLTISVQPRHAVVADGQAHAFSVSVGGGEIGSTYSYTWTRSTGGTPVPVGGDSPVLYIGAAGSNAQGAYSVKVSDGKTTVNSITVALQGGGSDWTWRNPLPTGNDLWSVAFGGGKWLAVGLVGSFVGSDDNGASWTLLGQDPPASFNRVIYAGGKFVAVGSAGNVYASADLSSVTQTNVGAPASLLSLTERNGIWVAGASSGELFASSDLTAWTRYETSAKEPIYALTATADGFLALTAGGSMVKCTVGTSGPTGLTWTVSSSGVSVPATGWAAFIDVKALSGGAYVASGGDGLYTSTNGQAWTKATMPTTQTGIDWRGLAVGAAGTLVAVGNRISDYTSYLATSADNGATWTARTIPLGPVLNGVTYANNRYVAVGALGHVITSGNAVDWSRAVPGGPTAFGDFNALATGPAGTVAAGVVDATFLASNHESGWSKVSLVASGETVAQATHRLLGATYGDGKYVLVGGNESTSTPIAFVFSSSSAASGSWTKVQVSGLGAFNAVTGMTVGSAYRFVAAGPGGNVYYAGDPAGTWEAVTKPVSGTIRAAAAGNGAYVLTGDNGVILRSTDGVNWTAPTTPVPLVSLTAVATNGSGVWVAGGLDNRTVILRSTDNGVTWGRIDVPYSGSIRAITFADGRFRTMGGSVTSLVSADGGLSWSAQSSGFWGLYRAVTRTPKGLVAAGTWGAIATLSQPALTPAIASVTAQSGAALSPVVPVTTAGGVPPYVFSVFPALPAGLEFNSSTGAVSGMPSVAVAIATYTVVVTDQVGVSASSTFSLTVNPPAPAISGATTATATVGTAFSYQITASNSPTSYTATGLPAGLSVNTTTGLISGTPTTAGSPTVALTATNAGGTSATVNLVLSVGPKALTVAGVTVANKVYDGTTVAVPSFTSATLNGLMTGETQVNLVTTGATAAFADEKTGTGKVVAIAGLTLSGANAANYTVTQPSATADITKAMPVITWSQPAAVTAGTVLGTAQLNATATPSGGTFVYSPASGTTLSTVGTTNLSVTYTPADSANYENATAQQALTVNPPAPAISGATTATATVGTAFSYQITASNSPTSYTATGLPAGLSVNTTTGLISGTPTTAGSPTVALTATNAGGTSATVNLVLSVGPKALTVAGVTVANKVYDGTTVAVPSFTSATLNGLMTGETQVNLVTTGATAAFADEKTGTGKVVAIAGLTLSGANAANYTVTQPSATADITKAVPVITWSQPAPVISGTVLSGTQLNATAVPSGGTFVYNPPSGTAINSVGSVTLSVSYTPSDTANYSTTTAQRAITVTAPVPVITSAGSVGASVGTPFTYQTTATNSPTSYGATGLASWMSFNSTSGVLSGTPTTTGTTTVSLTASNSGGSSAAVALTVNVAAQGQVITFNPPVTKTFGDASFAVSATSDSGLPVTISVASGPATISGGMVTLTGAGTVVLRATADSSAQFAAAMLDKSIIVGKRTPVITWAQPASVPAGTVLGAAQLNATANLSGGTFTYVPAAGTALTSAGTTTLAVQYTPADTANNNNATAQQTITVTVPVPVISSTASATTTVGSAFSYQITASNSPTSYAATGLPAGLSLNAATGVISGTPTTLGSANATLTATNAGGSSAPFTLAFTIQAGPAITTQPSANAFYAVGNAVTLSVAASGNPAPTYQWRKGGVNLSGKTGTTLSIASLTVADAGTYDVVVANEAGSVASLPVTFAVYVPPTITTQPVAQTVVAGGSATFSMVAAGDPSPSLQWRRNGLNIPGATASNLTLSNVTFDQAGTYSVYVSNAGGNVTSNGAALTVNPVAPVITSPLAVSGVRGLPLSYQATATSTGVTFSSSALPSGLALNASSGQISGTPTTLGTTAVTIMATNVTGTDSKTVTFVINPPPPVISSALAFGGRVNAGFLFQVTASNTPTSYAATGLPAGLSINAGTGVISGTPSTAGVFDVVLTATNAGGSATSSLQITIEPPLNAPTFSGPTNLSAVQGTFFTFTPAFSGAPFTANFTAVGMPAGVTLSSPSLGTISGTPTVTGTSTVTITATNDGGAKSVDFTLVVNPAPSAPVVTSASTLVATVGFPVAFQLTSQGTPAATSYQATGLPAKGLDLNSSTGLISGVPNQPGTLTLAVSASSTGVGTGQASALVITINPSPNAPVISSAPLATGRVGVAFSYQLQASNNPSGFLQTSGTLPAGLSFDSVTGAISGTPTEAGDKRVWFAGDSVAYGRGFAMEVLFSIAPPATAPVISSNGTAAAQVGLPFQYQITATNSPTGFAATGLPEGLSLDAATGVISGLPLKAGTFAVVLTATKGTETSDPKTLSLTIQPAPATPVITSPLTAIGRAGESLTYNATASESPTSFAATGLPAGLSLASATGVISGTPTVSGTFTVTLRAANGAGLGAAANLVFTLSAGLNAPSITSAGSVTGKVGAAGGVSYQAQATPGPIVGYAITGKLPLGLTFNTSTGLLSGNPAEAGLFSVQLTATNAGGVGNPQSLVINISPSDDVPVITSPTTVYGMAGTSFTYQISASSSPPFPSAPFPAPFLLDAVNLPPGLAVNPSTGLIQGTPTASGTYTASLVGTNSAGTGQPRSLTLVIDPALTAPVVNSPDIASAQAGVNFSYQITATEKPTGFEVLGAPVWMAFNSSTGAISGVPSSPGTVTVDLVAKNASGTSKPTKLTLSIAAAANAPVVTSPRTASGTVQAPFTYQATVAVPTGAPPVTSYFVSGLPSGLSFSALTGAISGTPLASGTFAVTLVAKNSAGESLPVTLTLTIAPNITFNF